MSAPVQSVVLEDECWGLSSLAECCPMYLCFPVMCIAVPAMCQLCDCTVTSRAIPLGFAVPVLLSSDGVFLIFLLVLIILCFTSLWTFSYLYSCSWAEILDIELQC